MLKKTLQFTALLIGLCLSAFGQTLIKQHTYLDALALQDIYVQYTKGSTDKMQLYEACSSILAKYQLTPAQMEQNVFLQPFRIEPRFGSGQDGRTNGTDTDYQPISGAVQTASPIQLQTALVNGVSQFMAQRFRQEVLHMALVKMLDVVGQDKTQKLQFLFPKTLALIQQLRDPSQTLYAADLSLLQQATQLDLEQWPTLLTTHAETLFNRDPSNPDSASNSNPNVVDLVKSAGIWISLLQNRSSIDQTLSQWANAFDPQHSEVASVIHLVDMLSQALRAPVGLNAIWVNPTDLWSGQFFATPLGQEQHVQQWMFYGLLYEQLKQFPMVNRWLSQHAHTTASELAVSINQLLTCMLPIRQAETMSAQPQSHPNDGSGPFTWAHQFSRPLQQLLLTLNPTLGHDQAPNQLQRIAQLTDSSIELLYQVQQKNYAKAVSLLLLDFGTYMSQQRADLRPLLCLGQMAATTNADDVQALLESYALPLGSASIKRHSSFNVSLNGYVGCTSGVEMAPGNPQVSQAANAGLTAPLGVSTTFGRGRWTALASVVDLGTVVNQRLNNNSNMSNPVKIEQFLAPGVGLLYNLPQWPVSVGVQYSYLPRGRYMTDPSTESSGDVAIPLSRFQVVLLVDIPFFTLFQKDR